jgi:hypothetical protein
LSAGVGGPEDWGLLESRSLVLKCSPASKAACCRGM